MKARYNLIDKLTAKLLDKYPDCFKAPVKIERIIKRLGISLIEQDFDLTMSGAAIIDGNKKIISVNKNESASRKRFTIAHELGHILLHYDQELNVDLKPIRLNRDFNSGTGESWREIEANYFAATILMPSALVEEHYDRLTARLDDDDVLLGEIASKFGVSVQAMSIRLAKLELFKF